MNPLTATTGSMERTGDMIGRGDIRRTGEMPEGMTMIGKAVTIGMIGEHLIGAAIEKWNVIFIATPPNPA